MLSNNAFAQKDKHTLTYKAFKRITVIYNYIMLVLAPLTTNPDHKLMRFSSNNVTVTLQAYRRCAWLLLVYASCHVFYIVLRPCWCVFLLCHRSIYWNAPGAWLSLCLGYPGGSATWAKRKKEKKGGNKCRNETRNIFNSITVFAIRNMQGEWICCGFSLSGIKLITGEAFFLRWLMGESSVSYHVGGGELIV